VPIILVTSEAEIWRIEVQGQAPSPEITRAKADWRCGREVECLLCKHEALSSNTKKNKKSDGGEQKR
jgi:hypothetical protein